MTVVCVGIGADGWDGLTPVAQQAFREAEVLFGMQRQLDLVPLDVEKVRWGTPLVPSIESLLSAHEGRRRVVVASGDPLFYGIGSTLRRLVGDVRVVPHLSSLSLACAREGWSQQDVTVVSLVGRPLALLTAALHDGALVLVLSADASTPAAVARSLATHGFGASELAV